MKTDLDTAAYRRAQFDRILADDIVKIKLKDSYTGETNWIDLNPDEYQDLALLLTKFQ